MKLQNNTKRNYKGKSKIGNTQKGITQADWIGLKWNKGVTEKGITLLCAQKGITKLVRWNKGITKSRNHIDVCKNRPKIRKSKIGLSFMLTWYMILCAERCAIFLNKIMAKS